MHRLTCLRVHIGKYGNFHVHRLTFDRSLTLSQFIAIPTTLVFSFLIYNPFFLLLFLFEVSPLILYVPSSSVVWFLLPLTGIFLLLPVLTPHLICALSN